MDVLLPTLTAFSIPTIGIRAIIGIGTVELNLPGGSTLVLHNVRHVPELSSPLISVRQLDETAIRDGFSSGGWTLLGMNKAVSAEEIIQ